MKADEIDVGTHVVGAFVLIISRCAHDSRSVEDADYFEVLFLEPKDGMNHYVHLHEDPRFDYFGHFGKFERLLSDIDLVEHNAYVNARFVSLKQPTWKLHRHSISRLVKLCEALTKAAKKSRRG